jgi:hypothetical protein
MPSRPATSMGRKTGRRQDRTSAVPGASNTLRQILESACEGHKEALTT